MNFTLKKKWNAGLSGLALGLSVLLNAAPAAAAEEKGAEEKPAEEKTEAQTFPMTLKGDADTFEQYRVLIDLIDNVSRNYVHSISREELIRAAIQGVTSKLDPYSYYIDTEGAQKFRQEVASSYGGVGIAIDEQDGKILVLTAFVNSPAYTAGVHAGDILLEIDGVALKEKKLDEVLELLSGEIGTSVKIKVLRTGNPEPMEFTVNREAVHMETVLGFDRNDDDSWNYWLDEKNGIAYIHITEFRNETATEIQKVLELLQNPADSSNEETKSSEKSNEAQAGSKPKLNGLILDLRFNPGGNFNAAVKVCDMFIEDGVLVSVKGKNTVEESWKATPQTAIPMDVPLVVLLNSYSASASEVVSACLQDHQRAVMVGERSYGKGIIQSVLPFEGGTSSLKLTTAGYVSPNGKNIQREEGAGENEEWGVKPKDEHLVQTSAEEDQMFLADRNRRGISKTHNDLPVMQNPAAYRDIQLEKALQVLLKALKLPDHSQSTLQKRSAPYREGSKNVQRNRRRSYWGR